MESIKEQALKVLGMHSLWDHLTDMDDWEQATDLEYETLHEARTLALAIASYNPHAEHTRWNEVWQYAKRKGVRPEHAVVMLVNAALSNGLDQ
jgi:hypothetical protein